MQEKVKVAILSRHFSQSAGGAESYAVNLALKLTQDYRIHVFCERSDVLSEDITIHRMAFNIKRPRWIAQWAFAVWSWRCTREGFAIVHAHENTWHGNVQTVHVRPMRYSLFAKSLEPLQRFFRYIKVLTSPRLMAHLMLEGLRYSLSAPRLIVVVTPALGDIVSSYYHVGSSKIRVVTPGIQDQHEALTAHAQALVKQEARASFGLQSAAWVLMVIGHNFEKKGLPAVLRALEHLSGDVSLLVVGGGEAQVKKWRSQCEQSALAQRVVFTGLVSSASKAYAASDCLVHATLDDIFPLVVLESFAARVPVVLSVSPYCLASDLMESSRTAHMLKNPQQEAEIVKAVNLLRSDDSVRLAMMDRAELFAKQHTWTELASRQRAIYEELIIASSSASRLR